MTTSTSGRGRYLEPVRLRLGMAILSLLIFSCGGEGAGESSTTTSAVATTAGDTNTTSTLPPLVECPPLEYQVTELPTRVTGEAAELGDIELDQFTAIGGTRSVFWVTSDGSLAIALDQRNTATGGLAW